MNLQISGDYGLYNQSNLLWKPQNSYMIFHYFSHGIIYLYTAKNRFKKIGPILKTRRKDTIPLQNYEENA